MTHNSPQLRGHILNPTHTFVSIRWILIFSVIISCFVPAGGIAQDKKTGAFSKGNNEHSITRAAVYSAVLPGLGQAYNRKFWKIPIIYAGFGVLGYFVVTNNKEFKLYKEAYIYTANNETYPIDNPYVGRYNATQLQEGMDYYRRNRDLSYIIGGVWYIANVLEAYVDAHFFEYDISEDLTFKVSPTVNPMPSNMGQTAPAIKITLKF